MPALVLIAAEAFDLFTGYHRGAVVSTNNPNSRIVGLEKRKTALKH
jgi:hypothetical protein